MTDIDTDIAKPRPKRRREQACAELDDARQPPQDLAAEQSVLGGMLLSKDAIADVLERLRPGDFYRPAHQNVYDASWTSTGAGNRPMR